MALAVAARDSFWDDHCATTIPAAAAAIPAAATGTEVAAAAADTEAARGEATASGAAAWRRQRPLVAASVGPYGATLTDGSEYVGQYTEPPTPAPLLPPATAAPAAAASSPAAAALATAGGAPRRPPLTAAALEAWHMPRLALLAGCDGVDVLALETVPSIVEVWGGGRGSALI